MTRMKRKVFWIVFLVLGIAIPFFLATLPIFKAVSWDGHSETDIDGSSIGCSSTDWKSSGGILVFEGIKHYSSAENARNALEKNLGNYGAIIERKKKPGYLSDVDERIIATS